MFSKTVYDPKQNRSMFRHHQVGEPSLNSTSKMTQEDYDAFKSMLSAKTVTFTDTRQLNRVVYEILE